MCEGEGEGRAGECGPSLQLVGIGALCLACKHEEVMIPNMNDFIFICDNAYTLQELMVMEVDILATLQVQLHMPTPHDMLLPMLQSLDEAPSYPDASIDPSPLRNWCEALLLLGQAQYQVVLHDPSTLARCVATLGGLLSRGCHSVVFQRDGSVAEGKKGGKLAERVCWLKPGADWRCLEELLDGIESAACESREMLVKCHSKFIEMHSLSDILDKYVPQLPRRGAQGGPPDPQGGQAAARAPLPHRVVQEPAGLPRPRRRGRAAPRPEGAQVLPQVGPAGGRGHILDCHRHPRPRPPAPR